MYPTFAKIASEYRSIPTLSERPSRSPAKAKQGPARRRASESDFRSASRLRARRFLDRHAPVDAVFVWRIVAGGLVHHAPVVPDHDIADPPAMNVAGIRRDHPLGEILDHVVAMRLFEPFDGEDLAGIEIQRLAPSLAMNLDHRVQRRRPVAVFRVQQRLRILVAAAICEGAVASLQ